MSVVFHDTTAESGDEAELTASEIIERVNAILGYDVLESAAIEADRDTYRRTVARLSTADFVQAEQVLGPLDDEE